MQIFIYDSHNIHSFYKEMIREQPFVSIYCEDFKTLLVRTLNLVLNIPLDVTLSTDSDLDFFFRGIKDEVLYNWESLIFKTFRGLNTSCNQNTILTNLEHHTHADQVTLFFV